MAKDFAAIYAITGDSISLEQKFFAKLETTKGTLNGPTDSDFFFTQAGSSITHNQPKEVSPHRSGRHQTDIIQKKKVTEWGITTFVNIDTTLGAAATAEVDTAVRLLWKSLLGNEDTTTSAVYNASQTPDLTFSLFENGDKWAQQVAGSFVDACTANFPGDGEAGLEWSGRGKDRFRVGIGQSTIDNGTHTPGTPTITLAVASEAKRFPVGALVMVIEADGTTRSADTPNGTYRTVVARDTGTGVVTLDGADLADSDGSGAMAPVYLCYAEPESPTGISDIQTGLVGSISIDGLGGAVACVRSMSVTMSNNHEVVDYCYGTAGLASPFFVPGGRLAIEVEAEINLNDTMIEFLDDLDAFTSQDIDIILGDSAGRHLKIDLPKVIFDVPSTSLPDEGSIPVTVGGGAALQTALEAEDEITVSYL